MMKFKPLGMEFDAVLQGSNNIEVPVTCEMDLPFVAGDEIVIVVGVPNNIMPAPVLTNPCNLRSSNLLNANINVTGLHFHFFPGRTRTNMKLGTSDLEFSHIGEIKIASEPGYFPLVFPMDENKFFLGVIDIFRQKGNFSYPASRDTASDLYVISVKGLGNFRVYRTWVARPDATPDNTSIRYGYELILEDDGENKVSDFPIDDVLLVLSVLGRQRVLLHGFQSKEESAYTRVWRSKSVNSTPFLGNGKYEFLIYPDDYAGVAGLAISNLLESKPEIQRVARKIGNALCPSIVLGGAETYISLFHALELCRSFASSRVSDPSVLRENADLVEVLSILASQKTGKVAQRLRSYAKQVSANKPDLKIALTEVLIKWGVPFDDLWPLASPEDDSAPCLIQVRNVLAHSGADAVLLPSLTVASWHLRILLERIFTVLVGIDSSNAHLDAPMLKREIWYSDEEVANARRTILLKGVD